MPQTQMSALDPAVSRILIPLTVLLTVAASDDGVILTTDSQYELYSGDLDVTLSIPATANISRASLELVSLIDDRRVTAYQVPTGFVGDISVTCGAVDFAGQFVFQLVDRQGSHSDDVVAKTLPINVSWPSSTVTLSLPPTHRALTSALRLSVDVDTSLQCDSVHQGVYYMLQLLYLGANHESNDFQTQQIVNSRKFPTLTSLGAQQMTYDCQLIDQAGVYQAVVTSSHDSRHVVAKSNRITVLWSEAYKLTVGVDTILPCSNQLIVKVSQPSCSLNDDKVRLYVRRNRHSQLDYITERRVSDQSVVSFSCRLFNSTTISYCFKYISTANNGAVNEQSTRCLPTSNATVGGDIVNAATVWGEWSKWEECMPFSECGRGQRVRHRLCNADVHYCQGNGSTIDYKSCSTACTGDEVQRSSTVTFTMVPGCQCGCALNQSSGYIVASSQTGCPPQSIWLIRVPDGLLVRLTFVRLGAQHGTVRVHDGNLSLSNLLLQIDAASAVLPQPLTSTGNMIRLEYVLPPTGDDVDGGFVARFLAITAGGTVTSRDNTSAGGGDSLDKNSLMLTGVGLCMLVVLLSVAFVCHRQRRSRKLASKLSLTSTPAHEALLSRTEQTDNTAKLSTAAAANDPHKTSRQRDKKTDPGGSRSKLASSSPARSREAGYQLAASRVPLADDEDVHGSLLDASECISLRSYDSQAEEQGHSNNVQETSYILDERPPVEGRDSVSKEKVDNKGNMNDGLHAASYVPAARSNVATVRELQRCERPKVEPLPLSQNVDRADMSSPGSHEGSPFTKKRLFTDDKVDSPLSDVVADDFGVDLEYDDYMPQLPGSYFAMDPHAYTLTWSKQPSSWTHQPEVSSRTGSDASADPPQTADS